MLTHKFFERNIKNDLNSLKEFLLIKNNEIIINNIENGILKNSTQLAHKYNIFKFEFDSISNLQEEIRSMTQEACEYYKIDYDQQNYMIRGWFNYDNEKHLYDKNQLHDHSGGTGIPNFHGYYCVDAEPSVTHYAINKDINCIFENINKNNRAILSETGHPHARGNWKENFSRITIAYDISPHSFTNGDFKKIWIRL